MNHQSYRPKEVMPHPDPEPETQPDETGEGNEDPLTEDPTNRVRAAALTPPLGAKARRTALSLSEL